MPSIRTVTITPPALGNNLVLYLLIEDLKKGALQGFDGIDPLGREFKIFIELVGFIYDYPASASLVDVYDHVRRTT